MINCERNTGSWLYLPVQPTMFPLFREEFSALSEKEHRSQIEISAITRRLIIQNDIQFGTSKRLFKNSTEREHRLLLYRRILQNINNKQAFMYSRKGTQSRYFILLTIAFYVLDPLFVIIFSSALIPINSITDYRLF